MTTRRIEAKETQRRWAAKMRKLPCRHCGRFKVNRPRQLCWHCYYTPGLREKYPPLSKYAHRGNGHQGGKATAAAQAPCEHPPGSVERVEFLAWRARNNLPIFDKADAREWHGNATPLTKGETVRANAVDRADPELGSPQSKRRKKRALVSA